MSGQDDLRVQTQNIERLPREGDIIFSLPIFVESIMAVSSQFVQFCVSPIQLITNGDFETPKVSEVEYLLPDDVPGWSTEQDTLELWETGFNETAISTQGPRDGKAQSIGGFEDQNLGQHLEISSQNVSGQVFTEFSKNSERDYEYVQLSFSYRFPPGFDITKFGFRIISNGVTILEREIAIDSTDEWLKETSPFFLLRSNMLSTKFLYQAYIIASMTRFVVREGSLQNSPQEKISLSPQFCPLKMQQLVDFGGFLIWGTDFFLATYLMPKYIRVMENFLVVVFLTTFCVLARLYVQI